MKGIHTPRCVLAWLRRLVAPATSDGPGRAMMTKGTIWSRGMRSARPLELTIMSAMAVALLCASLSLLDTGRWLAVRVALPTLPREYLDAALDFGVRLPSAWKAESQPGMHSNGQTDTIIMRDTQHPALRIELTVTRGAAARTAFASRGAPNATIGSYPAIVEEVADVDSPRTDGASALASTPAICHVDTILAGDHYVVGQECGLARGVSDSALRAVLATYAPTPSAGTSRIRALSADASHAAFHAASQGIASRPKTCAELVASATDRPTDMGNWGRELVSPTDARWSPYPLPGAAVCSNFLVQGGNLVAFGGYLFQCVELANRFLREQWGHGSIAGNAATWFDYADASGTPHPGTARVYPDVQLSDDASQGISSFKPGPGDILVWQDVRDGTSWKSGLSASTGHVAVVTSVDATQISFMQQNYNDRHSFMSLPIERVANGWHIRDDVSGVPGRIVRGWIHVIENGGAAPPPSDAAPARNREVYAIGGAGTLYTFSADSDRNGGMWTTSQRMRRSQMTIDPVQQPAPALIGAVSAVTCGTNGAGAQLLVATGRDGNLYTYTPSPDGRSVEGIDALPGPAGIGLASSPSVVCYQRSPGAPSVAVVYVLGGDQHLYRYALEDGAWSSALDVSVASSGRERLLSAAPAAVAWAQGDTWHEAAYATGEDGHLYEFRSDDAASWRLKDLTNPRPAAWPHTAVWLGGTPSVTVFSPPGTSQIERNVFVVGGEGHLYRFTAAPESAGPPATTDDRWSVEDISHEASGEQAIDVSAAGAPERLTGSPSAHELLELGHVTQLVFVTGSNGHLYAYDWGETTSSAWRGRDISMSAAQAQGVSIIGPASGYSYTLGGDPRVRHSVFALSADGQLAEFAYLQAATPEWTLTLHAAPVGSALDGTVTALAWTR